MKTRPLLWISFWITGMIFQGISGTDVLMPFTSWHIWILTSAVCILILLVMIMIIRSFRSRLSFCTSRLPRGTYISPVPDDGNGTIPLNDMRISCGNSDHAYASIADEEEAELSHGSVRSEQTDRSYEPVGNVINP